MAQLFADVCSLLIHYQIRNSRTMFCVSLGEDRMAQVSLIHDKSINLAVSFIIDHENKFVIIKNSTVFLYAVSDTTKSHFNVTLIQVDNVTPSHPAISKLRMNKSPKQSIKCSKLTNCLKLLNLFCSTILSITHSTCLLLPFTVRTPSIETAKDRECGVLSFCVQQMLSESNFFCLKIIFSRFF